MSEKTQRPARRQIVSEIAAVDVPPTAPVALGADWQAVVERLDLPAEIAKRTLANLQTDIAAVQDRAARHMIETLQSLAGETETLPEIDADAAPGQLQFRLLQPDGSPAVRVRAALRSATVDGAEIVATERHAATSLADGSVLLKLPVAWLRLKPQSVQVAVMGGSGTVVVTLKAADFGPEGQAAPVTLPRSVDPVPLALLADLGGLAALGQATPGASEAPASTKPQVALGEDECAVVFRTDASQDRFPYGVLFRLTDPGLSNPTLAGLDRRAAQDGREIRDDGRANADRRGAALRAVFPDDRPALPRLELRAVERVAIDRPLSVQAFRRAAAGITQPRGLPVAATLAIGYVVHMAQRWTQRGLSLGNLVYSLPLAPGEQQRVAVMERTATSLVQEREAQEQREDLRFDETDTSSAQATFSAGFTEAASGGSAFDASSSSFSVAAAAGGGGVFPFGAMAGGVSTSYGSASSSGSSSSWMNGARNSTSNAAQATQASVSRRASANRSATRSSMRLATSSETTSITTKVITNHNKTRALTMQYWEVHRLFDVQTVVEDVSLVCMVPFDVIDFLPLREPARLSGTASLDRGGVLYRYGQLLENADVLLRIIPWRMRRGVQALLDFVADPRATVQAPEGAAINIVNVTAHGAFTAQDQVRVQLMLRGGIRTAAVPLSGPATPLPTGNDALETEAALFEWLRQQRRGNSATWNASVPLPASVALADVIGVVVLCSTRRLVYAFAPEGLDALQRLFGGAVPDASKLPFGITPPRSVTRSYDPGRVAQEIGPLTLTSVNANVPGSPAGILAEQSWAGGTDVPEGGLVISARRRAPELSYDSLLEIERSFQWVLRNAMTCTTRITASLTAEERAVLLERYSVVPPTLGADGQVEEGVSLLACVTNNVLGFFGNAMVLPFQIPFELAQRTGLDSGKLQSALRRFHTEGFDNPTSVVALPTNGVLGEAVLGRCPAAEKIDLTRFWNWKDSPGDEATAIQPVGMPQSPLLTTGNAPSELSRAQPIINNFSTQGPGAADTSLAAAIGQRAIELGKPFDIGALTNSASLAGIVTKTADNAEAARKDALASATKLAEKAMDASVSLKTGKPPGGEKPAKPETGTPAAGGGGTGGSPPAGGGPTQPPPAPTGTVTPPPPPRPETLRVFFNLNETDIEGSTNEGLGQQQQAKIQAFADAAKASGATEISVFGFASPEGTPARNAVLVKERAEVVANAIAAIVGAGITVNPREGGVLTGAQSMQFPSLRRADAKVTAP